MCWSGEASAALATVGFGTAAYVAYKGESRDLWIPLTYFSCMEMLQAATYVYIDQCQLPQNKILTLLGYLHIAFQPFFVNMVAMYFIPGPVRTRIRTCVYALCVLGTVAILMKLYPFPGARICLTGYEGFCGRTACSLSGDWHIAWQLPLNGLMSDYPDSLVPFRFGLHAFAYFAVSFFLPLVYGSWRFVGFHLLVGPVLADILTVHPNEHAAVWCLLSIGLCVSVIKTPLRRYLRVQDWPLFRWTATDTVPRRPRLPRDRHMARASNDANGRSMGHNRGGFSELFSPHTRHLMGLSLAKRLQRTRRDRAGSG
jgi:hypothetical protein